MIISYALTRLCTMQHKPNLIHNRYHPDLLPYRFHPECFILYKKDKKASPKRPGILLHHSQYNSNSSMGDTIL